MDNRIIKGMQEWKEREQNMAGLFSPDTLKSRYFQQLKLDYLRDLTRSVRKDASSDERMTARILRGQTRDLERKLYPNYTVRMAMKLYRFITDRSLKQRHEPMNARTDWMMKVDTGGKKNNGDKPVVRQMQRSTIKPLEKKRVPQNKGHRL